MTLIESKYKKLFDLVFEKRRLEIRLKQYWNRNDHDDLLSVNRKIDKLLKEQLNENEALKKLQTVIGE